MEDLEKKVAISEKQLNKKQVKIDELIKDVELEKDNKKERVLGMQEEYDLLMQRVVKLQAEVEY